MFDAFKFYRCPKCNDVIITAKKYSIKCTKCGTKVGRNSRLEYTLPAVLRRAGFQC